MAVPRTWMAIGLLASMMVGAPAGAGDPTPAFDAISPADFFPGGILGVQLGSSWQSAKNSPSLGGLTCQPGNGGGAVFDEICYFRVSRRVAGADIHDGFIVGKDDRVVLIGTGIPIKNADDPLAESVMRDFQSLVHAGYQQTGGDVLFVNLPERHLSAQELQGFSRTAPVLLVELEAKENELAVFYGYLAPVNAFSALTAN